MESNQTITIQTQPSYLVHIGSGLLDRCGQLAAEALTPCRAAVVTDSNVAPLYLSRVEESLRAAGFSVCAHVFPAGEARKNLSTLSDILEFLAQEQLTRSDCVVALGGGVCGDMAGFAAGCYLRGVAYVQIPTTLLSSVDSSVGGKTAVDLRAGKNLAGLFLQPSAVVCDTDCLRTLPPLERADGTAEALKTGVLSGEELFSLFEADDITPHLSEIVGRCIAFKGSVVEQDPLDNGLRRTLNLGHTAGHAIEKCSGYALHHGHAVAAGLAIIARAAEALGWADEPCAARICAALRRHSLPTGTEYAPAALAQAALADKKRRGGSISLVVPRRIGKCEMVTVPVGDLERIFAAGWEDR